MTRGLGALAVVAALTAAIGATGATAAAAGAAPPHVMVIVEENRSESSVIGSPDAPYINSLVDRYGLATAAYGQSHPSLPNYLELLSGSTQGVHDDGTGYTFGGQTLADQLSQNGFTWRAYMESMPSACYSGGGSDGYAKKHDPFMYFTSITGNPSLCGNVVPFGGLQNDLSSPSAPDFAWVTPNLCDDGHDCSTSAADSWLGGMLPRVLASSWFASGGIVIVTWDEGEDSSGCCNGAAGGQIATIVVAAHLSPHATLGTPVDHAGTLRTIEQLYGLPYLGDAACACSGSLIPLLQPPALLTSWLTAPHLR